MGFYLEFFSRNVAQCYGAGFLAVGYVIGARDNIYIYIYIYIYIIYITFNYIFRQEFPRNCLHKESAATATSLSILGAFIKDIFLEVPDE